MMYIDFKFFLIQNYKMIFFILSFERFENLFVEFFFRIDIQLLNSNLIIFFIIEFFVCLKFYF